MNPKTPSHDDHLSGSQGLRFRRNESRSQDSAHRMQVTSELPCPAAPTP